MTSPVAGLRVGKVLPEAESTHLLLMSSLVAETFTVGSKTVVAVAMISSSLGEHSRKGTPVRQGKQEWECKRCRRERRQNENKIATQSQNAQRRERKREK